MPTGGGTLTSDHQKNIYRKYESISKNILTSSKVRVRSDPHTPARRFNKIVIFLLFFCNNIMV